MWVGVHMAGSAVLDTLAHRRQLSLSSSPPLSKSGTQGMEISQKDMQRKREWVLGAPELGDKCFENSDRLYMTNRLKQLTCINQAQFLCGEG